jgi:ankyrin repeat protein
MWAAFEGHATIVEVLLSALADPFARNRHGMTPLILASMRGHLLVVELLIYYGAHLEARDELGETALVHAIRGGHAQLTTFLLRQGADPNVQPLAVGSIPLVLAVTLPEPRLDVVCDLLDSGANIDVRGPDGRTPLASAAWSGHVRVRFRLLAYLSIVIA